MIRPPSLTAFIALVAVLGLLCCSDAICQTPPDVPESHWAYTAVSDLAAKGLIKGYPPDGHFLGSRTLTRYEMAALVQRILARTDELLSGKASRDDLAALQAAAEEIRKLTEEFKLELTVIGTDMQKAKADLQQLRASVNSLTDRVNSLTRRVDDADLLAEQALSQEAQVRAQTQAALARKVDAATGRLRVRGVFQVWYGTAFGDSLAGSYPTPSSPAPPGRTFGGGVGDTFRLRRGQIYLDGSIDPQVDYRVMFDVAKTGTGANGPIQDLWAGFKLGHSARIQVGSMKPGLSEEGASYDYLSPTVERSIMNTLPLSAGQVGAARDVGAMLQLQNSLGSALFGIWNDNGNTLGLVAADRRPFATAATYITAIRHLTVGAWGGARIGDSGPPVAQDRAGATLLWQSGPHYAEAEGAYTLDHGDGAPANQRTIGLGGYFLYGYRLTRRWQLVGRIDEWDPALHGGIAATSPAVTIPYAPHDLREYTFGVNYMLDGHNAEIKLNYIRDDVDPGGYAFFGKPRSILISDFQVAF